MTRKIFNLIGACSGLGASVGGCEKGAEELLSDQMRNRFEKGGLSIHRVEKVYPSIPDFDPFQQIHEFNIRLAHVVKKSIEEGAFPLVLGGDHVNAVGVWNGIAQAVPLPLGLIWIDAHMDSHTPQTTVSGAWHGMPLAALMGYGDPRIAALFSDRPVLNPENICLIGVRSYEEGEFALLKKLGVKIYFQSEVDQRGFKEVFSEALHTIEKKVESFGVSIDLDAFDPKEVEGVGSPVPNGIKIGHFLSPFSQILKSPKLVGVEIVEYNPNFDPGGKTKEWIYKMIVETFR